MRQDVLPTNGHVNGAVGGATKNGPKMRAADAPGSPPYEPAVEGPQPPRGPSWPGHRTFLSIYGEDDGKLFVHRDTSLSASAAEDQTTAWLWMAGWCNCFVIMGLSLQGFSLNSLASRHGLDYFEVGSLFSATKATAIVGALLSHSLMSVVYPSHLLLIGVVLKALAIFGLGCLHWLPVNLTVFLALGATIKSIGGIGLALYFTAMYSLLFYKHQSCYIVPLIVSEVAVGVGGVLGPIVGHELIRVWIYPLPYFVVGGCMLLGMLIAVALPLDSSTRPVRKFILTGGRFSDGGEKKTASVYEISAHVIDPQMSEVDHHVDLSFAIIFGAYAVGAIFFGLLTWKFEADALVIFVAQLISCIGFLFVGPVQFIPLPAHLWLTRLGIGLAGFAAAGQFLPVIARVVHSATWRNQCSDLWTITAAVAAAFAATQLGGLAASLFSAYVTNISGPAAACTILLIIQASWAAVRFLVWVTECAIQARSRRML